MRGSIACLDCAADKAAGRPAKSCLNHCQREGVAPGAVRHVRIVPLPAVTMCVVWTAARNAPVFVWGAVRAGSWNTPVGAACDATREGGRRGSSRSQHPGGRVCARNIA